MKINVDITEGDYLALNEHYNKTSSCGKRLMLFERIGLPVLLLMVFLIFWLDGADTLLLIVFAAVSAVGILIWELILPKLMRIGLKCNIKRIKKDGKLPFQESAEIEFTDKGITSVSPNASINIDYKDVSRVGTTDSHIFIFFGAVQAVIIPRRCLNGEDVETFLAKKI